MLTRSLYLHRTHLAYIRGRQKRGRSQVCEPQLFPIDVWNQHDKSAEAVAYGSSEVIVYLKSLLHTFRTITVF